MGVKDKATRVGMKVMTDILNDPERVERLGQAVKVVQKGRESVRGGQHKVLNGMGLASGDDVAALGRRLSRLRRRMKALVARANALSRKPG